MATVVLPALLRPLVGGAARIEVSGTTLREALEDLERQQPGLHGRVVGGGAFRPEVFVAINGDEAFGLDAVVPADAEIYILPAIAGGAPVPIPRIGEDRDIRVSVAVPHSLQRGTGEIGAPLTRRRAADGGPATCSNSQPP